MGGFNGSGVFVRSYSWQQDAAAGLDIIASRFDAEDDGFAGGLSLCITRDGQGAPTAAIYWGNQDLTGVKNLQVLGTLSVAGAMSLAAASTIADPAGTARLVGYRGLPIKQISTAYTVTIADVGFMLEIVAGGSIVLPRNSTLGAGSQFTAGDTILFQETANASKSIAPAASTNLFQRAGTGTGARTLAARGLCSVTLAGYQADTWFIGGDIS